MMLMSLIMQKSRCDVQIIKQEVNVLREVPVTSFVNEQQHCANQSTFITFAAVRP
jgi:hypothetical protein